MNNRLYKIKTQSKLLKDQGLPHSLVYISKEAMEDLTGYRLGRTYVDDILVISTQYLTGSKVEWSDFSREKFEELNK